MKLTFVIQEEARLRCLFIVPIQHLQLIQFEVTLGLLRRFPQHHHVN